MQNFLTRGAQKKVLFKNSVLTRVHYGTAHQAALNTGNASTLFKYFKFL
jgi:hypothetical protein